MSLAFIHSAPAALAGSASIASLCCIMQLQWVPIPAGGAPCTLGSSGQRQFCETGLTLDPEGFEDNGLRTALCYTFWGTSTSDFVHAPCGMSIPGYEQIGPMLPGGQCCYLKTTVSVTSSNQDFSVLRCNGDSCS